MLSSQRRGGIASIALGLNVAMMLLAAIGLYGAIRLQVVVLLVHASLVIALILVFVLSFLATVLFGSGGAGSSDSAIIYIVFVFFLFDLLAAGFSLWLARGLVLYRRAVRALDGAQEPVPTEAGGTLPGEEYTQFLAAVDARTDQVWRSAVQSTRVQPRAQQLREEVRAQRHSAAPTPTEESTHDLNQVTAGGATSQGSASHMAAPLGTCAVCLTEPADTLLYDCGHVTCKQCSGQLRNRFGHCPFCRKRILDTVAVFAP